MARKFNFKVAIKKFWIRLHTAWWILFHPKSHWVLMHLDEKNLIKLIKEESLEVNLKYHGLVEYNIRMMCKFVANTRDDIDYILDKASYEAAAFEKSNKDPKK